MAEDLTFRHSEQHPYLYRNLKLRFEPAQITVLMGASGSGKSALAKLLQGFYQPTAAIKLGTLGVSALASQGCVS